MTLNAIGERDIDLVMAAAMLLVAAAILGNLLQDLAYVAPDPRIETETRD